MTGLAGMLSNRYRIGQDIPDQTGKTAIVTGGSAGIGLNIALGLALAGAKVHILSSTPEHGEEAIKTIQSSIQSSTSSSTSSSGSPGITPGSIEHHTVDLGSLSEVLDFSKKIQGVLALKKDENGGSGGEKGGLEYLVLNAGVGVAPFGLTKDGLGNHFQVNHLSHFLLATSLLPLMTSTSTSKSLPPGAVRIVTQSSELHRTAPSDSKFETVEELSTDRDANALYARSKLMGILFTKQLAKRKLEPEGNKIVAIATHPGAVATDQEYGTVESYGNILGGALVAASRVIFMAPEQGAESALWATTAEKVEKETATYQGCYLRQPDDSVGSESSQAQEEILGVNLWNLSKKVVKDKVGFEIDY